MSAPVLHRPVVSLSLPAPVGPYSPAVTLGNLVFVSGQVPVDPATGAVVGEDIETQTAQVLKNLATVLEAAGSSLQHVVRCGVFLTDLADFPAMNRVYEAAFAPNRPARSTVQVAALPGKGIRVEIDVIAYAPGDAPAA